MSNLFNPSNQGVQDYSDRLINKKVLKEVLASTSKSKGRGRPPSAGKITFDAQQQWYADRIREFNNHKDRVIKRITEADKGIFYTNLKNPKHLNFLFNEYKKEGLIPKQFKTPDDLLNYVQNQIDAANIDPQLQNKKRSEILKNLVKEEFLKSMPASKRANADVLEVANSLKWEGLPIIIENKPDAKVKWHRRGYSDKPPKHLQSYIEQLEKSGVLPEGYFKDFKKWANASWKAIGDKNRAFKKKYGLNFDIGHFIASAFGGPNVGTNARPEQSHLNRSKGKVPGFATPDIPRALDIPDSWAQAFYQYDLDRQNKTLIPRTYNITAKQFVDVELGTNPEKVLSKRRAVYDEAKQAAAKIEELLAKGQMDETTAGEFYDQMRRGTFNWNEAFSPFGDASDSSLKLYAERAARRLAKNPPKNEILQIYKNINNASNLIPTPVKRAAIVGGALLPGALGTTASAFEVIERGEKYEKTKNWLDGIQLGLANASLFTGWSGVGEIIATPADLLNLGLDLGRFPRNPIDTANRQRYRHGKR